MNSWGGPAQKARNCTAGRHPQPAWQAVLVAAGSSACVTDLTLNQADTSALIPASLDVWIPDNHSARAPKGKPGKALAHLHKY